MKIPTPIRLAALSVWAGILLTPVCTGAPTQLAPSSIAQRAPRVPGSAPGQVLRQEVTVFHGTPGAFGSLARYEIGSGRALRPSPSLVQIKWLALELVGRTQWQEGQSSEPQWHGDLPAGAARIQLPGDRGNLYHYSRQVTGQGLVFGYLHVPPLGQATSLFERPGLLGSIDPFLPRVAVGPDGERILVSTLEPAGGDVFEIEVRSGAVVCRTKNLQPLRTGLHGMWLGRDWGFVVTSTGVVRFEGAHGQGEFVGTGAAPASFWSGEGAMNQARTAGVVLGGSGPTSLCAYVVERTGDLNRVHPSPREMVTGGYLPETLGGPFLGISDDAQSVAWVEREAVSREVVLARVQAATPPVQATSDPFLLETLQEVGRIRFRQDLLVFAAGEPNDPTEGGLESAEFFSASLSAQGSFQMDNLSQTMGDLTLPFLTGVPTLTPALVRILPGGDLLLFDEEEEAVMRVDMAGGGTQTVLSDVKDLHWWQSADPWVLCSIRRRSGSRPVQLARIHTGTGASSVVDPGSPGHLFHDATYLGSGWFAYRSQTVQQHDIRALQINGSALVTWPGTATQFVPPLKALPGIRVGFSPQAVGQGEQWLWSPTTGAATPLQHPGYTGHILP